MVVQRRMRIAVVGSGISGVTAAYMLSKHHDVTLYEKNATLGGHTNTRVVEDPECGPLPVDTGFIVCNHRNYPNFYNLLAEWQVPLRNSDMSFGYYCASSGLQYKGPAVTEFLQAPFNLLKPRFVGLVLEQRRFNQQVLRDLRYGSLAHSTLGSYLETHKVSHYFIEHYLVPIIASIWSSPDLDVFDFPMTTFATFFKNHGMLELSTRPQWQTVVGGSHEYLKAFSRLFPGTIRLASPVERIARNETGVIVATHSEASRFDKVVLASHANESLGMLEDPSVEEQRLLGRWRYNANHAVLHTDAALLPPKRRLWASWNYARRREGHQERAVGITYHMNRLQGLPTRRDYFVTLNRTAEIDHNKIIYEIEYHHPVYTPDSVEAQGAIQAINGAQHTYYCGAYLGYGFHEDGVRSAIKVTEAISRSPQMADAA